MTIENEEELQQLQHVGAIVARCLRVMRDAMEPGMTTRELDAVGARFLEEHGAQSAPRLTYGFPGATCISVNEDVAHGVPGERVIERGDLVNIDVSAAIDGYTWSVVRTGGFAKGRTTRTPRVTGEYDGIFADTGGSFVVGGAPSPRQRGVCDATREALNAATAQAKAGAGLIEIGRAVERVARRRGLRIIKELCSHGVGRALHEEPGDIKSYVDPRERRRLTKGLVITIEPFLTTGNGAIVERSDGWTLSTTSPAALTAQYEHTMVITEGAPLIVTRAA